MLGAIIGDIAGSRFEFRNIKTKKFGLLTSECYYTDDTVMTLAIAKAIMESRCEDGSLDTDVLSRNAIKYMKKLGRKYPDAGYGGNFYHWLFRGNDEPYGSWGNGAAMRVSACGDTAESLAEALSFAEAVTKVTHNHPEGIKGAKATAAAIYLASRKVDKEEIRNYICDNFYDIDFTLDDIRERYTFDVSCQGSVPQALEAFFEAESFQDTIKNAISIGGDSDTIAAIAGGIAEAYYGIPPRIADEAFGFLDRYQKDIIISWYERGHGRTTKRAYQIPGRGRFNNL